MKQNSLKQKLKEGKVCIGTFARLGPAAVEILGYTGWDFAVIDMEHGVCDFTDMEHMVRAARCAGLTSIIRVAEPKASYIMRALDAGADGVQIPQVETAQQAKEVTEASRYFPNGKRGLCSFTRAAGYSTVPVPEHLSTSNDEVLVVVHVEGEQAGLNIEETLENSGIDVVFLGPWDLSQSLGVPGEVKHPKVIELMEKVIAICLEKGVAAGTFVANEEDFLYWVNKGVTYFTYKTDAGIIAKAEKEIVTNLNIALEQRELARI